MVTKKKISERDKLLYENKWVQILERDKWFTYMHNIKSQGKAVMVLVYDFSDSRDPKILGRYEHHPCHDKGIHPDGKPHLNLTSITGSFDKPGKSLEEVAVEELKEEAGITAAPEELESLGYVYQSKASDTVVSLYALDGSNKEMGELKPDNSPGERDSFVEWHNAIFVVDNANCSLLGMAFARLLNKRFMEGTLK